MTVSHSIARPERAPSKRRRRQARKLLRFLDALREAEKTQRGRARVLVFANKIKTVHLVTELLRRHGHKCSSIHGERTQARHPAHAPPACRPPCHAIAVHRRTRAAQ